jgi:hypothetical protein
MFSIKLLAFTIFILAASFALQWRRSASRKRLTVTEMDERRKRNKFHCVQVVYPTHACGAIRHYANKRFLSSAAPVLPLADCNAESCSCRFEHFDDRRQDDRRNPISLSIAPLSLDKERRTRRGRRIGDQNALKSVRIKY